MEKTISYQSFNLRYSDIGEGVPVVLLHGFGEDSRIWDKQAAFLSANYRLIIPDLPGSGGSLPVGPNMKDQTENGIPASIDAMADAVNAILEKEKIASFTLLGH